MNSGETAEAEAILGEGALLLAPLLAAKPNDPFLRTLSAFERSSRGALFQVKGHVAEADAAYRDAVEGFSRLVEDLPQDVEPPIQLVWTLGNLAKLSHRHGDSAETDTLNLRLLGIAELAVADFPESLRVRMGLVRAWRIRTSWRRSRGDTDGAVVACRMLLHALELLAADFPDTIGHRDDLGHACYALGQLNQRADPRQALGFYSRAAAVAQQLEDQPGPPATARRYLGGSLRQRAVVLSVLGRFAEAAAGFERAAAVDEAEPGSLLARTALALDRADQTHLALATAEQALADHQPSAGYRYQLARLFAHCVPNAGPICHFGRVKRAMALLHDLRAERYFEDARNAERLRTDADLDPLRQRADFEALLAPPGPRL